MPDTKSRAGRPRDASRRFPFVQLAASLTMAVIVGGASVACGNAGASDPTPVVQFKITPAPGTYTTAPAATPTAAAIESPIAPGNAIKLVAQDLKFDQSALTAAAGPVTINLSNKDGGVPHNLHVFDGTDAKGLSVGQTDLASGPVDEELKLDLVPGRYYFQCDAHPTTMKGTLTVR
jgi:plastocyanin